MKVYSTFDDLDEKSKKIMLKAGINLFIHPHGIARPNKHMLTEILDNYDAVMLGTSQKISPDMLSNIVSPKIIATASSGIDHIEIPESKKKLVKIVNTPKATGLAVAEYTFANILSCYRRLAEGNKV